MAICEDCKKEMNDPKTKTCTVVQLEDYDGHKWQRIPYPLFHEGVATNKNCVDCGVVHGGYHHKGCDQEICPLCGGQLLACKAGLGCNLFEEVPSLGFDQSK